MAHKEVHNNVLDAALDYIKDNGTKLCVCKTSTDTYAKATSANKLASVGSLTSANYTGPADYSGSSGGRKLTVSSQSSMNVTASGDAEEVAIVKSSGSLLLFVTTCTKKTLSSGDKVTVPSWVVAINDPS